MSEEGVDDPRAVALIEEQRAHRGAHARELGLAAGGMEDVVAGFLDGLAEALGDLGLLEWPARAEGAPLVRPRLDEALLDGLDRDLRGGAAACVPAHPIGHDEEPEILVEQVRVLVVRPLATHVALAEGCQTHRPQITGGPGSGQSRRSAPAPPGRRG